MYTYMYEDVAMQGITRMENIKSNRAAQQKNQGQIVVCEKGAGYATCTANDRGEPATQILLNNHFSGTIIRLSMQLNGLNAHRSRVCVAERSVHHIQVLPRTDRSIHAHTRAPMFNTPDKSLQFVDTIRRAANTIYIVKPTVDIFADRRHTNIEREREMIISTLLNRVSVCVCGQCNTRCQMC